jgi:hypothetical protein
MQNTDIQLVQPSLDLSACVDPDACARELKRCSDEADRCAALAQAGADLAIRHAWNAGAVCLKAKEIVAHGEFQGWLEANAGERGYHTMLKWMKLAKVDLNQLLADNPKLKGLQDAYIATGILPEPEPKPESGEGEKGKPPFVLSFKTNYKHPSEWSRDAVRDFLYEFDRIARTAMQLKTEFGL